jgi:hypothetical protein
VYPEHVIAEGEIAAVEPALYGCVIESCSHQLAERGCRARKQAFLTEPPDGVAMIHLVLLRITPADRKR